MIDNKKQLVKILQSFSATGHRPSEAFSDFVEVSALSLANVFLRDPANEKEYARIQTRYGKDFEKFPSMFAHLVGELDAKPRDVLGELYMEYGSPNTFGGQFFTPHHLCVLMAQLSVPEKPSEVDTRGFFTVSEPCCGSGAMIIALAEHLKTIGVNPQTDMHVSATDISHTAFYMAYVQLSLFHIPAIVSLGNSLSVEFSRHWPTPAHFLGGWDRKLSRERVDKLST